MAAAVAPGPRGGTAAVNGLAGPAASQHVERTERRLAIGQWRRIGGFSCVVLDPRAIRQGQAHGGGGARQEKEGDQGRGERHQQALHGEQAEA
jgi:hypothetical protein